MKRNFFLTWLSLLAFAFAISCSDNGSEEATDEKNDEQEAAIEVVETVVAGAEAKTVAAISIEGMSCQVMCANSIKKAIAAMEGVVSCEVAFEEKLATVEYDQSLVNEEAFIAKIESLQEGKYSVSRVDIQRTVPQQTSTNDELSGGNKEKKTSEKMAEKVSTTEFNIPDIFDIFTRLYSY